MKKVAAAEFKARCLKLIDQVHDTGKPITITKRGKIVAVLQPARPLLADVSLWEVAIQVQRGRLVLTEPLGSWLKAASHPRVITVAPIDAAIAAASAELPATLRDPADRLIVATSRTLQEPLLTHDVAIACTRPVKRWMPAA
jgi:prevent-host-death family protein